MMVNEAKKFWIFLIDLDIQSIIALFYSENSRKLIKRLRLEFDFFLIQICDANSVKSKRTLRQSIRSNKS